MMEILNLIVKLSRRLEQKPRGRRAWLSQLSSLGRGATMEKVKLVVYECEECHKEFTAPEAVFEEIETNCPYCGKTLLLELASSKPGPRQTPSGNCRFCRPDTEQCRVGCKVLGIHPGEVCPFYPETQRGQYPGDFQGDCPCYRSSKP